MAKIISNPTEEVVRIVIEGDEYSVGAGGEILVEDDERATRWIATHGFLVCKDVAETKPAKAAEKVIEAAEEEEKETKTTRAGK